MTTNRRILVDNATLSGVMRLTGKSKTINLRYVDNDILCLEKLITAILFSDSIIGIDDYKEKYKSKRLKTFDFIEFINIKNEDYKSISRDAAIFAKSMTFSFDGSKPSGDVVSFFESLRIDPQLRWDVFVSSEYLTLSALVKDKDDARYEASIDSIFRNENTDEMETLAGEGFSPGVTIEGHPEINDIKDLIQAFASKNPRFKTQDHRTLLRRFVFGYGWAAERSYFYNVVAAERGADAFLAPLRDAFCESCCRLESRSQINSMIERLKSRTQDCLVKIVDSSGMAKFVLKMPFFAAYFISKTDNPKQCIDLALQMRNSIDFQECREILHNMAYLSSGDRYKEVNGILNLLEKSCASLMSKYAVTSGGGVHASVSIGLSGPSVSANTKLGHLLLPYRNRSFSRIFRNIAQDMLNVERLGSLYDKLCSSIRRHEDATYPAFSVTPKFMEHRESESGRPAELE